MPTRVCLLRFAHTRHDAPAFVPVFPVSFLTRTLPASQTLTA